MEYSKAKRGSTNAHFISVLIAGGIGTFVLSYLRIPQWITLAVPTCTILYYSVYSYSTDSVDRDIDSLQHHAEQIYLLGYLLTLFAIFGVALTPGGEIAELIKAASVKLLASLAGITAMLILKEISHGWEQDQTDKHELFAYEIGTRISNFQSNLDSLSLKIQSLEKVINAEFFEETANLKAGIQNTNKTTSAEVEKTIVQLSKAAKGQHDKLEVITETFTNSQKDFAEAHSENLNIFKDDLAGSLKAYSESHSKLIEEIRLLGTGLSEQLKENFDSMDQYSNSLGKGAESLSASVGVTAEASKLLHSNIAGLDVSVVNQNIADLGDAISQIAGRFKLLEDYDSNLKRVTGEQTSLQEGYIRSLKDVIPAFREHQNQLTTLTLEARSQIESLKGLIDPEKIKLEESSQHVQVMADRMTNVLGEIEATAKSLSENASRPSGNEARGGFGSFFRGSR